MKKYAAYLPTVVLLLTSVANAATPAIAAFWIITLPSQRSLRRWLLSWRTGCLRHPRPSAQGSKSLSKAYRRNTL